jgi:hypothetical protein
MSNIPSVSFVESSSGVLPVVFGVRNRVLVIGEFDRGPTIPTFLGGYKDFSVRYGSSPDKNGSLGVQAVYEQGATNVAAIRVLGNEKRAHGDFTVSGITTNLPGTNYDYQTLSLNVNSISKVIPYTDTVLRTNITAVGTYAG